MSADELLLGIDVGSYSSKGVLTTLDGVVVASHAVDHDIDLPRPGWAQQDADAVWWHDIVAIARHLGAKAMGDGDHIIAVGISAIGPCLLPVDALGRPLGPAILYGVDARAREQIKAMNQRAGAESIAEFSRMELSSQAVGPKLWWLREHQPQIWKDAAGFATATSYLVARLTGRNVMDHHTAAHWMPFYDPESNAWSGAIFDEADVLERLPELGWADELAGTLTPEAAQVTGLPEGLPVAVGTVDALSEGLGVGVRDPGDLMIMYGSTAFFILRTSNPVIRSGMWCLPGAFAGEQVLAAGMATSGAVTRWFRDGFARELPEDQAYHRLFDEALDVPAGARGLLALPYFSGERTPISDPDARGVIAGLSLSHGRADVFRALLEGVAYGIRHNLEAMSSEQQPIERAVAVGGGTRSETWLRIVSDASGRTQQVPRQTIGASYGDAYLAGLAAGSVDPEDRWAQIATEVVPDPGARATYDRGFGRYKELYLGTREVIHGLSRDESDWSHIGVAGE